jgi:hypothetical protein
VFDFWRWPEIFLFSIWSRPAVGPTQLPVKWVPGVVSPGIKQKPREADPHLHQVPRLRVVELCLHSRVHLHCVSTMGLFQVAVNLLHIAYTVHSCTTQFAVLIRACVRMTVSMAFSSKHCHLVSKQCKWVAC